MRHVRAATALSCPAQLEQLQLGSRNATALHRPSSARFAPTLPSRCPPTRSPAVNSWGTDIGKLDVSTYSDFASKPGVFKDMQDVLQNATVVKRHLFVTASGNSARLLVPRQDSSSYFFMPAQLQADSILTVGATGALWV